MSKKLLKVQPIRNGTVIDHIKAGTGRKILDVLGLSGSATTVSLLINIVSKKQKRKDIIKIEDRELSGEEIEKLALITTNARVNIIRNYAVANKKKIEIPDKISGTVICQNDNCISNSERNAVTQFRLIGSDNIEIQCIYCRRKLKEEEIVFF